MGAVGKGDGVIKRIGLLVMVALVATMMLVATAGMAFAAPPSEDEQPNGNCGPGKNLPRGLVRVKGEGKPHMEPSGRR